MVEELINSSGIISSLVNSLPVETIENMTAFLNLGKIALGVLIIYLIVLILLRILRIKDSRNISKIAKNSAEINSKLDFLLKKHHKPEHEKPKPEKPKSKRKAKK